MIEAIDLQHGERHYLVEIDTRTEKATKVKIAYNRNHGAISLGLFRTIYPARRGCTASHSTMSVIHEAEVRWHRNKTKKTS
jgi:hypothetical protein